MLVLSLLYNATKTIELDMTTCTSSAGLRKSPNEQNIPYVVNTIPGGFGYTQDINVGFTTGYFSVIVPRRVNGQIETGTVQPLSSNLLACADSFNADQMNINIAASTNVQCWPLAVVYYVGVRKVYSSTATDGTSCDKGYSTLLFVQWLLTEFSTISYDAQNLAGLTLAPVQTALSA